MKLIKIVKYGFYTGIDSEQYFAVKHVEKFINSYLLEEFGNADYSKILKEYALNGGYFLGKITSGLGDIEINLIENFKIVE